jgi:hypothetical protein
MSRLDPFGGGNPDVRLARKRLRGYISMKEENRLKLLAFSTSVAGLFFATRNRALE